MKTLFKILLGLAFGITSIILTVALIKDITVVPFHDTFIDVVFASALAFMSKRCFKEVF